ncbi:unnamed protein product, partial [Urochloa humidicola]
LPRYPQRRGTKGGEANRERTNDRLRGPHVPEGHVWSQRSGLLAYVAYHASRECAGFHIQRGPRCHQLARSSMPPPRHCVWLASRTAPLEKEWSRATAGPAEEATRKPGGGGPENSDGRGWWRGRETELLVKGSGGAAGAGGERQGRPRPLERRMDGGLLVRKEEYGRRRKGKGEDKMQVEVAT